MEVLHLQDKTMIKILYLVGAGGIGKQLKNLLKKNKFVNSVRFVDDELKLNIKKFFKMSNKVFFNIAISKPSTREKIYKKFIKKKNFFYKSIIFPNKNIYSKKIKDGCIIEPNTIITNNVSIGIGNFIFFGTSIGHDVFIGNFCNFGCNVVISGETKIGNKVEIGANSFISNKIKICDNVKIAPGSVVLKDIKSPGVYHNNSIISTIL